MRTFLFLLLTALPLLSNGQLLWSTQAEDVNKRVTVEQGMVKTMETYDLYDGYTTYLGFTHEQWLDDIEDEQKVFWQKEFEEAKKSGPIFSSFRTREKNDFDISILLVVVDYVDAEYISRIVFSNNGSMNEITNPFERAKFERWIRTFIKVDSAERSDAVGDQGDKTTEPKVLYPGTKEGSVDARALYGSPGDSGGGAALEMAGWIWDRAPDPNESTSQEGIIVFEVAIDDRGNVLSAKPISYTVSQSLVKVYQKEVERLTFSKTSSGSAPERSTGRITFIIKVK